MQIYNHEREEKRARKDKNDLISNLVGGILLTVMLVGGALYAWIVEKDIDTVLICLAAAVITCGLIPYTAIKIKRGKVSENIRYQEMRDLTCNRQILNSLNFDYDNESLDCITTKFGIEIGYMPNKYAYFNASIDAKSFAFGIELIDDVYDFEYFDELCENEVMELIDEYKEEVFDSTITKDIIINKFKTYIEENKKLMEEIAVLCEKYYLLEVEDNEENNC